MGTVAMNRLDVMKVISPAMNLPAMIGNNEMRLSTIKEVSILLNVKASTLYSWVHNGSIPYHKLNGLVRFDLNEIEAWVKSSKSAIVFPDIGPLRASEGIATIIKKAIDSVKGKEYNPSNGKPGPMQGLRKEE